MAMTNRDLTEVEKDEFLKNSTAGILAFAGDEPYAIPIGMIYKNGDLLLGLSFGRKWDYMNRSHKVCYTIHKARWHHPDLKVACTTIVIEGELEVVKDRFYLESLGIPYEAAEGGHLFRLKPINVGAKQCTTTPCGYLDSLAKNEQEKESI